MRTIEATIINPLIGKKIPLPSYSTDGTAATDLRACITTPLSPRNETDWHWYCRCQYP